MTAIAAPRNSAEALAARTERHAPIYYLAMACIAIAAGWLARLSWGFWTDEAGSYWMAGGGWSAAIAKTENFPGQSLLYSGVLSWFYHPGPHQELWLRIPSVAGVLLAGYFLYRLTEDVAGKGTGYLAVVPFFCTPAVIQAATYARPYGLALAAATGCAWKFQQFLNDGRARTFAQYLVFSVLMIYFQYFFGFLLAVQTALMLYFALRGKAAGWRWFLIAPPVWLASLWPLRASIQSLVHFAGGSYSSPIPPSVAQFFLLCFPMGPLIAGAVGCVAIADRQSSGWPA